MAGIRVATLLGISVLSHRGLGPKPLTDSALQGCWAWSKHGGIYLPWCLGHCWSLDGGLPMVAILQQDTFHYMWDCLVLCQLLHGVEPGSHRNHCHLLRLLTHLSGLFGHQMLLCPRLQFGFVAAVSDDTTPPRTHRS